MRYKEIERDLFTMPKHYALAHCISRDCKMGAGIAYTFNKKFPLMKPNLIKRLPSIGDALLYQQDDLFIYNLITKENFWHKPTRESFNSSLVSLKGELINQGITKLAMPRIGAGLDRLAWKESQAFILELFADTDIDIIVCVQQQKKT